MLLPEIILFLSIIIWLFPPFRQYKGKFFFYFLILALLDPLIDFIFLFASVNTIRIYSVADLFMIISLINLRKLQKYLPFILPITVIVIWFSSFLNIRFLNFFIVIEHLVILIIFLKMTIVDIYDSMRINLFYIMLDLYLSSLIFKFLANLIDLRFGLLYFYLTSAFEILIGIFFILYNEENSPKVKLISRTDVIGQ